MKVIFFTPRPFSLAFGGTEVQLLETKAALEEIGVFVEFADYFDRGQISEDSVVHFFGSDYVFAQTANLLIGKGIPYVVSSVFYPTGFARVMHKISAFLPMSVTYLRKRVISSARRILPNSRSEAKLLAELFGLPQAAISIVPNGVSTNVIGEDPNDFRRKYLPDLPTNERFILSVGRIEKRKNTLALLRAAAKIRAPIVFIGLPTPLATEKEYISKFMNELENYPGYAKHIPFLPPGSRDLANAYAAAHSHALISWMETPGLVSLEAGINGANLVVGESPPVREYLSECAFFVRQTDIVHISRALEESLSLPRDNKSQSKIIKNKYSWSVIGQTMLSIYREVL